MHHPNGPTLLHRLVFRAREQRRNPTPSEHAFWNLARMRKLGVRIRRAHPLPPYIADFYVPSSRLVIEIDGGYHLTPEQRAADAHRTSELQRLHGVRVLRIDAELVLRAPASVAAIVRAAL